MSKIPTFSFNPVEELSNIEKNLKAVVKRPVTETNKAHYNALIKYAEDILREYPNLRIEIPSYY